VAAMAEVNSAGFRIDSRPQCGGRHGFEDFSDDFAIWVIFYGPVK
jgi:hypothetical protein